MSGRKSTAVVALICIAAVMMAPVGPVAAQEGGYELTVDNTVELADRTVTIEGETFTESSIARVSQGSTISASVDAPADASYTVNLYNNEFQIVDSRSMSGPSAVEFGTSQLSPGSYMVGVLVDGEFQAIQSVVVPGYDLSLNVRRTAPGGDQEPGAGPGGVDPSGGSSGAVQATVRVTPTAASGTPNRVQVAVVNDEITRFFATRQIGERRYRVTIPRAALGQGTFTVVGAVRGTDTLRDGRAVVNGLSGTESVEIRQAARAPRVGASTNRAADTDGDGVFEDVNGDGDVTPGDATVLFSAVFERENAVLENSVLFDVNGDGEVTPGDATVLFNQAFEQSQNRAIAADLEG